MKTEKGFYWEQHGDAEKLCLDLIDECKRENEIIARFEEKLHRNTSSRLIDWVDHCSLRFSAPFKEKLETLGFIRQEGAAQEAFFHPGALLPTIVFCEPPSCADRGIALRVDSIADFMQANEFRADIEGSPFSPLRRAVVSVEKKVSLSVVERRGTVDYEPVHSSDSQIRAFIESGEEWQKRQRSGREDDVFREIFRIADNLRERLGRDLAAHVICRGERQYWHSRNLASRVQQARHETLGIGWGNHDHYTFRSSRRNFAKLVTFFSGLGFHNRERFYAGEDAGWGAQVMENPRAGLTLFLDVDLAPDEAPRDFSQEELRDRGNVSTVGLWCALHGDSILEAGMHHFAARFDFGRLIEDIALLGVAYMPPFSNFTYFKQAFSVAEKWQADPARVASLVGQKSITNEQSERFLSQGAVGSHLENIERREGYKGFNRKNVSAIIRETDPRRHLL